MFPSISRDRVLKSVQELHDLVVRTRRGRGKQLLFAVNRHDKKLDRIGTGYHRFFTNLNFQQVMRFCQFDIHCNDVFTVGSSVLRQVRGIAIGGTGSAQFANIDLFMQEQKFYPLTNPLRLDSSNLHPGDLPVHPFRYMDNLVGVKRTATPISDVMHVFEDIYGLGLQEEGEGSTLITLESELQIFTSEGRPRVGLRYADKRTPSERPEKQKYRCLPPKRETGGTWLDPSPRQELHVL